MRSFWAGVATTIVCGVFALFVLWFAVAFTVGNPRVVECIKDNRKPAVSMDIEAGRRYGYFRTYEVGACTAYFTASNKAKYFR
jgi:hypothetical protein